MASCGTCKVKNFATSSGACTRGTAKVQRASYNRRSYTRKNGTHVRKTHVTARCIKNQGSPGKWTNTHKSEGIGKLRKGRLGSVGYSSKLSAAARRAALMRAIRKFGALSTYRMLNAIMVYSKRTNPKLSAMYRADRNMVGRVGGLKH
jgi:hypothetical protein